MNSQWIDISVPLHNGMVHWPGDAPFERTHTLAIANGDPCNVSQFCATVHIGTHMDAPLHFLPDSQGIESMPLEAGIGPARVIPIQDPERIRIEELKPHQLARGERVLFKTLNSERCWKTDEFQKQFVFIPHDTAQYLAGIGLRTVGVDYLSVAGYEIDSAETHRALLSAGVWIIEGLNLQSVEPGRYELICLPLKMQGSDGAPARAIVRKLE